MFYQSLVVEGLCLGYSSYYLDREVGIEPTMWRFLSEVSIIYGTLKATNDKGFFLTAACTSSATPDHFMGILMEPPTRATPSLGNDFSASTPHYGSAPPLPQGTPKMVPGVLSIKIPYSGGKDEIRTHSLSINSRSISPLRHL